MASAEVLSPPPSCQVTSFSHDSFRVKCVRQQTSYQQSNESTTKDASARDDSNLRYGGAPTKVSIIQATRMATPDNNESVGNWKPDTSNDKDDNDLVLLKKPSDAEDGENSVEYVRKMYPQTPYVTLENKEQVEKQGNYPHSEGGTGERVSGPDLNNQNGEASIKQQARKDASSSNRGSTDTSPPYFVLTVREQETSQLIRNTTSK